MSIVEGGGLNRGWGLILFQRFLSGGLLEEGAKKRLGAK